MREIPHGTARTQTLVDTGWAASKRAQLMCPAFSRNPPKSAGKPYLVRQGFSGYSFIYSFCGP